jgi:LuxR family maltose regulon positive regulatory protein
LNRAEELGDPVARATAELHCALADLDVAADDLEGARQHLATDTDLVGAAVVTETHFRHGVAAALLAAAEGDLSTALGQLDRAEQLYRPGFLPDVRPIPAIRARMNVRQGAFSGPADWARDRGIGLGDAAHYLSEYDHLTFVRLVLAEQRGAAGRLDTPLLDRAVELLDRLGEAARVTGRAGSLVEIHLLRALTHDAAGRRAPALTALADALTATTEPEGCTRLFLDEGAAATELLRAVQRDRLVGQHARHLLAAAARHAGRPSGGARPGIRPPVEPLSERELQVLRLLEGELSGPDIARALFISPNTLRTHTKHVFTKLGVSSRREAVARARERGLLGPPVCPSSHPAGHIIG